MSEYQPDTAALSREWRAALIVVGGGFIVAIAVALYFAFWASPSQPSDIADNAPAAAAAAAQQPDAAQQEAMASAEHQLCRLELGAAQNFGLIPPFGKLLDPNPKTTDVQGRYVCQAGTQVSKYVIAADLVCRNLNDQHCVALYSVTQDDGTVLYKRQQ